MSDGSVTIHEPPHTDSGTDMRAFIVRELDGYYVTVNEARDEGGVEAASQPLQGPRECDVVRRGR